MFLRTWHRTAALTLLSMGAGWGQTPKSDQAGSCIRTRGPHTELLTDAGNEAEARAAVRWFEQLHSFFARDTPFKPREDDTVRVLAFRNAAEYAEYRTRAEADAYYLSVDGRSFVVMAAPEPENFAIAAHEYAHVAMHDSGFRLPSWLSEGLAEFYASAAVTTGGISAGAVLPARWHYLTRHRWEPLSKLLEDTPGAAADTSMFYAESWALVRLLVLTPEYSARFPALLAATAKGEESGAALRAIYGKPVFKIADDLEAFVKTGREGALRYPPVEEPAPIAAESVDRFTWRAGLADLAAANGMLQKARALYEGLAQEAPRNGDIQASLAAVLWQQGKWDEARAQWREALAKGFHEPLVCYRFAVTAENAGWSGDEIRPALECAAQDDRLDDAHFRLALLESNAGEYENARKELGRVHDIPPQRAFAYWSTLSNVLTEINERSGAKRAALTALSYAKSDQEKAQARQLALISQTDLTVRFTRDASGNMQMETTRVPHDRTHFNPFIEPGDDVRRIEGTVQSIDCSGSILRLVIQSGVNLIRLDLPDPAHVQVEHGPAEFTCGAQPGNRVTVEYAARRPDRSGADGLLRGLEFHP